MNEPSEHKYGVSYHVKHHPDGLTVADITEDIGACDRLFWISVVDQPGGAVSYVFMSLDRDGDILGAGDWFRIYTLLTKKLAEELPEGGRKEFCQMAFSIIRQAVTQGRDIEGGIDDVRSK